MLMVVTAHTLMEESAHLVLLLMEVTQPVIHMLMEVFVNPPPTLLMVDIMLIMSLVSSIQDIIAPAKINAFFKWKLYAVNIIAHKF